MLFTLSHKLPKECHIAVSGGPDSMAALYFLLDNSERVKSVIHVHHNTGKFANESTELVSEFAKTNSIKLHLYHIKNSKPKEESWEEFWRNERLRFFANHNDYPIVTGHNLNDCVEQYLINKLIKCSDDNVIPYYGPSGVIRPFRCWRKASMIEYCNNNKIPYLMDPSNQDNKFLRNHIRNIILPKVLAINPGIFTQVRRLILLEKETYVNQVCI